MKLLYELLWAGKYRERNRDHVRRYKRVKTFLNPSGTVADWGCGHGRLSLTLHEQDMDVLMVDIASNALDDKVKKTIGDRFICGSIHDTKLPHPVDYSICTDVLEHMEPTLLEEAVNNIISQTNKLSYFYVACSPDSIEADGETYTLHHTVETGRWWSHFFSKRWSVVETSTSSGSCEVLIG